MFDLRCAGGNKLGSKSSVARNSVNGLDKGAYPTRTALGLVAVMALCGCATPVAPKVQIAGQVSEGGAIEGGASVSTADAAYLFDGDLYLRISSEDGLLHGTAKASTVSSSREPAVEELVQRLFLRDLEKSVELTKPFPKKWHDFLIETLADRL